MSHERLGRNEILSKFIIPNDYGTRGVFPYGVGASIVLTKVSCENDDGDSWSMVGIYRNKNHRIHAEAKLFQLLDAITDNVNEINIELIQNFSPCNDDENNTFCAQQIVDYKRKMEGQEKQIDISIKFANFYRTVVYYGNDKKRAEKNREGLRLLSDNGVQLRLLRGEKKWRKFLNDEQFVMLSDNDREACWDQAISDDRKKREDFDKRHLKKILSTSAAVAANDLADNMENLQI